ncbi:hypothetical protein FACS1894151_10480 [Spirochaetia bacterium]|nr:hypothetical protein FACS1894151_10480 [Spirochaetia bacterium]
MAVKKSLLYLFILFLTSCDTVGHIFLTNGYPYTVTVYVTYQSGTDFFERKKVFQADEVFAPDATGLVQYRNIAAIRINDNSEITLAEYTPGDIVKIRNVYIKKKNQQESWLFTEKGLFLITDEVRKKFELDPERIKEYYRSDEAVKDLIAALEKYGA